MAEENNPNLPQQTPPIAPAAEKSYSADYVKDLREEAKNNRLKAQGLEKSIRAAFGLKDDEDIGDVAGRISARETAALKAANDRLIAAEIKSLEGYDHKLLAKVIDLSTVKVDENGNVTGVKEAAEAVVKEFPAVKAGAAKQSFIPPNPAAGGGAENPNANMNALIRGKR